MKLSPSPKHSSHELQSIGIAVAEWQGYYEFNYRNFSLSVIKPASPSEAPSSLHCSIGEGARRTIPHWQSHSIQFDFDEGLLFVAQTATSCTPANPLSKTAVVAEFNQSQNIVLRDFLYHVDADGRSLCKEHPEFTLALKPSFTISNVGGTESLLFPMKRNVKDGFIFEFLLQERYLSAETLRPLYMERIVSIAEAAQLFQNFTSNLQL
jgi:hypothetical protein